jgi:hypothetical protein
MTVKRVWESKAIIVSRICSYRHLCACVCMCVSQSVSQEVGLACKNMISHIILCIPKFQDMLIIVKSILLQQFQ